MGFKMFSESVQFEMNEAKQKKKERRRLQSLYAPSLHKNKSSTEVHYIQLYNITFYYVLFLLRRVERREV